MAYRPVHALGLESSELETLVNPSTRVTKKVGNEPRPEFVRTLRLLGVAIPTCTFWVTPYSRTAINQVDIQLFQSLREQLKDNRLCTGNRMLESLRLAWWMARGLLGEVTTAHSPTVLMRRSGYSRYKRAILATP